MLGNLALISLPAPNAFLSIKLLENGENSQKIDLSSNPKLSHFQGELTIGCALFNRNEYFSRYQLNNTLSFLFQVSNAKVAASNLSKIM